MYRDCGVAMAVRPMMEGLIKTSLLILHICTASHRYNATTVLWRKIILYDEIYALFTFQN